METKTKLWNQFYSKLGSINPNNPAANHVVSMAMSPAKYTGRAKVIAENLSDGDTILEIGCGYGGLARELMKLVKVSYTVVDNAEMLTQVKLIHGDTVEYVNAEDIESLKGRKFTMFISHFCLSETPRTYREYVLRNIIKNCSKISVYDFEDAYVPTKQILDVGLEVFPAVVEKYIKKYFIITKTPIDHDRFYYAGKRKVGNNKTICFVTRCHPNRPKMQQACIDSVKAQTCKDYSHLLFEDDKTKNGYGRDKADARLREASPLDGDYIMVLDDDDMLVYDKFVAEFREAVAKSDPDVVIFKGRVGDTDILPSSGWWGKPPQLGGIGSFCFAVKKALWVKYIGNWGPTFGDHTFIRECYLNTDKVLWIDKIIATTQRISGGKGE